MPRSAKYLVEKAVLPEIRSDPVHNEFERWVRGNENELKKWIIRSADQARMLGNQIATVLRDLGARPSSRVQASAGIQHLFKTEGGS